MTPQGACSGYPGPFVKVTADCGTAYHVVAGPWIHDNGTNSPSTTSSQNNWSDMINATVSGDAKISGSLLIEGVEAHFGLSLSLSASIGQAHSATYTVSPHTALHAEYAEYAEFLKYSQEESYTVNSVCAQTEIGLDGTWFNEGSGFHTWVIS
ncbi:hypothetical protein [Streptacidiphilus jiangxiensis]|uniref:Uncharacterized protein n=1 Tax=Streptacidiphilus jiangxiensis TaxID=235985 RepID=A0A1H7PAL4_STRJI|nr:hypothetical protein [Streptacidiphilus jiangxiensis]SEL32689.1 hypothetical protein SAMN05414137_107290 [Streptacidiphilus jiangxiensis]